MYKKKTVLKVIITKKYTFLNDLHIKLFMHPLTPRIKCNALHYAVDGNSVDAIQLCLQNGAKMDAQDDSGWTPLMRASTYKLFELTPSKRLNRFLITDLITILFFDVILQFQPTITH